MKKTISLVAVLVLATVSLNAQTEKGYMIVGTDFSSLSFNKAGFSFGVNPSIGWFLADNFALGGTLGLQYDKPKDEDGTFMYGILPTARYYFAGSMKNKIYGQVRTGIEGYSVNGNSSTAWQAGAQLGYNHFINKSVALELAADYTYRKHKDVDGMGTFDINFGLQIFLPGKKVKNK